MVYKSGYASNSHQLNHIIHAAMREAGWEIRSGMDVDGLDSVFYSTGSDGDQDIYVRVAAGLYDRQSHGDIQFPDADGYTKHVNFFAYSHFSQDGTLTDGGASSEVGRYGPILNLADGREGFSGGQFEEYNLFTGAGINHSAVNSVSAHTGTSESIVIAAGANGLVVSNSDLSSYTTTALPSSTSALVATTAAIGSTDYAIVASTNGIHWYDIDSTPSLIGTASGANTYRKIGTFTTPAGLRRFWAVSSNKVFYGTWEDPALPSILNSITLSSGTIVDAKREGYGLMLAVSNRATEPTNGSLQLVFLGGDQNIEIVAAATLAGEQPNDGEANSLASSSKVAYTRSEGGPDEHGYHDYLLVNNAIEESWFAHDVVNDGTYLYTAGQAKATSSLTEGWQVERRLISTGQRTLKSTFLQDADAEIGGGQANAIAADSSYLYVVGVNATTETTVDHWYWYIEKLDKTTLTPVDTWGDGDGTIKTLDGTSDHAINDIAIDSTHMYVVGAGASGDLGRIEKRALSTGALDTSFGGGSGAVTDSNGPPHAIAIDSTYMYVVTGGFGDSTDWYLEKRLLSTGALETAFGGTGKIDCGVSGTVRDIAVDATSIYIVGDDTTNGYIQKRQVSNGSLDLAFGGGDGEIDDTNWEAPAIQGIELSGSSIYIVGMGFNGWLMQKRYTSSGTLDSSFGSSGSIEGSAGGTSPDGTIYAVTTDGTWMYVAGYDDMSGVEAWRHEKREMSTGDLERVYSGFGEGTGIVRGMELSLTNRFTRDVPIQQIEYTGGVTYILDAYGITMGETQYNSSVSDGTQEFWGPINGFIYWYGPDGLSRLAYSPTTDGTVSRGLAGQARGHVLLGDFRQQHGAVNLMYNRYLYYKYSGDYYLRYLDLARHPITQGNLSDSIFWNTSSSARQSVFSRISATEPTVWALKSGTDAGWNTYNVLKNTAKTGSGTTNFYAVPPWGTAGAWLGWVLQGMRRTGNKLLYVARGQFTKSVAYYNIDANTWTNMPNTPANIYGYSQAVLVPKEGSGYASDRIYVKADYTPDFNKFFSIELDDDGFPVGTWVSHTDYPSTMTNETSSFLFYGGGTSLLYAPLNDSALYQWVFPESPTGGGSWVEVSGGFFNHTLSSAGESLFAFTDHLMSKVGIDEGGLTKYWIFADQDRVIVVTKTLESDYRGQYEFAYAGLFETYHDNTITTTHENAFSGSTSIVVNDIELFRAGKTYKIMSTAAIAYSGSIDRPGSGTRVVTGITGEERTFGNVENITISSVEQDIGRIYLTSALKQTFPSGSKIAVDIQPVGVSLKALDRIQVVNGPIVENSYALASDPAYHVYDIKQPQQDLALSSVRTGDGTGFSLWPVVIASEQIDDSDSTQVTSADTRGELIGMYFGSSSLDTEQIIQIGSGRYIVFNLEGYMMSRVAIGPME